MGQGDHEDQGSVAHCAAQLEDRLASTAVGHQGGSGVCHGLFGRSGIGGHERRGGEIGHFVGDQPQDQVFIVATAGSLGAGGLGVPQHRGAAREGRLLIGAGIVEVGTPAGGLGAGSVN